MKSLSICIPTYNHAEFLDRMLARLTSLSAFADGDVEVVVSDNASTDETQSVGERYASRYPDQVRYFRNAENVFDANFALALSRGTGTFLKLANDTLLFSDAGLAEMLGTVRRHQDTHPILFFSNRSETAEEIDCASFDALFGEISFHSTWIGSFGIWKSDFDALPDFARARELQLTQVDVLCRTMAARGRAVVNRVKFAESMPRSRIGGYNLAQVFGHNYFAILGEYVKTGRFSSAAFRRERFRMLRHHILPFYLTFASFNGFPKRGYVRWLLRDCWTSLFFWCTVPLVLAAELFDAFCIHSKKENGNARGIQDVADVKREDDSGGFHRFASRREQALADLGRVRVLVKEMSAQRGGDSDQGARTSLSHVLKAAADCGLLFDRRLLKTIGEPISKRTGESAVYWNEQEDCYYKVKNPAAKSGIKRTTEQDWFFEHIIHNVLFPETAYEFIGVIEECGELRIVLRQGNVSSETFPTDEQVESFLGGTLGLLPEERYFFGNAVLAVTDVSAHGDNVVVDDNGRLCFIDPLIRLKRPALEVLDYLVGGLM